MLAHNAAPQTEFVLNRAFFMKYLRKDWKKEFQGNAETKSGKEARVADFDIYVGETVAPLLAMALEQLTKVLLQRYERRTAAPQQYYRFNPCSWVAQFLLRKKTSMLYMARKENSFADWADYEKGRREMLRKRGQIQKVFAGFQKAGKVQVSEMPRLVAAIDETLQLEGYLKNHEIIPASWSMIEEADGTTNFQTFWKWFARKVLAEDLMRYSKLKVGELKLLAQERQAQAMLEAKRQKEEEEARKRAWRKKFETHVEILKAEEWISKILENRKMMLTGEEYPGGAQKDDEAPPRGLHVVILREFLEFLKLIPDQEMEIEAINSAKTIDEAFEEAQDAWNITAQLGWELWQAKLRLQLIDGVVDQNSLSKLLELDANAAMQIAKQIPELKARRAAIKADEKVAFEDLEGAEKEEEPKPSMEDLCVMYGLTMARIEWLHGQFKSFLPDGQEDNYPEDPYGMSKDTMRRLMSDLIPGMDDDEFESKFQEIDLDGGGEIEFDEFVEWLSKETIQLDINAEDVGKPPFEQLAKRHNMDLEQIQKLYEQFCSFLEEGMEDKYPEDAGSLSKEKIR
ncbi:unnamed protein product, partial [Amoebophrya sp. A25]|eukprot:GSA25T00013835001.1